MKRRRRPLMVLLIIGGALLLIAINLLFAGVTAGAPAFALAVTLALVPLPLYIGLALWADRFEPEPSRLLLLAFLWGAGIAAFFAGILNSTGEDIVAETFGREAGAFYGGSISAPIAEESLKGAALFFIWWKTRAINGVLDGIVYALMVGLGFAFAEEIFYYVQEAVRGGFPAAFTHFVVRGLFLGLMHPVWTAMTGVGIGIAVAAQRPAVKWIAPIAGLVAAMLLHSIHNSVAGDYLALQYGLMLPLTSLVLIGVVVLSLRREARIVREHVPPDVLPPDEVRRLYSIRGRIEGALSALFRGGLGGLKARDEYVRTISDLGWRRYRAQLAPEEERRSDVETMYRERLQAIRERTV